MPDRAVPGTPVNVVSPGAYHVSDGQGDVAGAGHGLFYKDTRHLSKFLLTVGGARPVASGRRARGSRVEFSLAAGEVGVVRRREVGRGMEETLELTNPLGEAAEVNVALDCAADFKDIFEVRGWRNGSGRGEFVQEVGDRFLRFSYRRGAFSRGTVVCVSGEGIEPVVGPGRISFDVRLESGENRTIFVSVILEEEDEEVRLPGRPPLFGETPKLETDWGALREGWVRSVEDLESLAFDAGGGLLVPAAGVPWFMALFGRDALITGYGAMILSPEPAKNALRALVWWQAETRDDFTDAEPGKIPHELRAGELAYFGEIPESPYYGTVDATPLFLVLLNEVWRWTGDDAFVREMESAARRALDWILSESDRVNGHVAYETRSTSGLKNQGWKDSDDSMLFRDGGKATGPIAPCEVQGYVFDALLRTAELAEDVWDDRPLAADLRDRAADLKTRFDRDFWMEERAFYALALDGEGRRVDSIASNAGHLLWSGIVPPEKARPVAARLVGDELFSGWGIRTMAAGEAGYDPDSYHNGSVWPHDNALIAHGLRRYGFREEASRVARAILDAAPSFDHRLPEVFAGHPRRASSAPVPYPTSCSPQAWAAASVPLLVRVMLGVEPDRHERKLSSAPALPEDVPGISLRGIPAFGERHTLRAADQS